MAGGELKPVEDIKTDDFMKCVNQSMEWCIESSVITKIQDETESSTVLITFDVRKSKTSFTLEAPLEHPSFIFEEGWSSCAPNLTKQRYGLLCGKLFEEDNCISLKKNNK